MRRIGTLVFLAFVLSAIVKADNFSLSFFQNATDNIFQSLEAEPDQISSAGFYFEKNLSKISLFAEGSYSYLFQNQDLSSYLQDIGLDYMHPLKERSALYFSLAGRGAFYRSDYNDFNYFSVNGLAAVKTYLTQTSILKSNYIFEYKKFRYSLFDFVSHSLLASLDTYFKTRTTLKSEINWGLKYFLHPYSYEEIPDQWGRGFRGGRGGYIFMPRTQYEGKEIQILSLTALLAQGLGDKIGLSVLGQKKWNLKGENPFSSVEEFYFVENPSYDEFSWEGYQASGQMTFELPWYIELKIGYTYSEKEFPGIESMSLAGDLLGVSRRDRRNQFEAGLEKNFPKFSVFLSYLYVDNQSNDPFFDWKGHFFAAGIEWNVSLGEKK